MPSTMRAQATVDADVSEFFEMVRQLVAPYASTRGESDPDASFEDGSAFLQMHMTRVFSDDEQRYLKKALVAWGESLSTSSGSSRDNTQHSSPGGSQSLISGTEVGRRDGGDDETRESESESADDVPGGSSCVDAAASGPSIRSIQSGGRSQQTKLNSFLVAQKASLTCCYCGEAGSIGCIIKKCDIAICKSCCKWDDAITRGGFFCDLHRWQSKGKPTIQIRSTSCLECGPVRCYRENAKVAGTECGSCGKRLCHFHAQTTPSARHIFADPKQVGSGPTNSRCKTCFGADIVGFEMLRRRAAAYLLGKIVGDSNLDFLENLSVHQMKAALSNKHKSAVNLKTQCELLAEEFSAFVYSLVCCGLGILAGRLMRILMTLNLACSSLGLGFVTHPFHLFYMLGGPTTHMTGPRMLARSSQSYGTYVVKKERERRKDGKAVIFPQFNEDKALANTRTRIAIALSDGLESSAGHDLMYGTIMHLRRDPTLEIWLIVRTPITTKQLQDGEISPFDNLYQPASSLQAALGADCIIYICSDNVDDYLVKVGMQYHWNVILHLHGFNDGHFWRSLVMAKLAEVYLDCVGMASLLLTDMGREVGVAHWTWTSRELVSDVQLEMPNREPVIFNPCVYPTEAWYQDMILSWGRPPSPSGPPGLLYGGECTRITETGGADFFHALIDILHQAFAIHHVKSCLHIQGPTSKIIQLKISALEYCKQSNYKKELCNHIVQYPFFRDKTKFLRFSHQNPQLVRVTGDPLGPHTGCVDGAITSQGSLHFSALGEWPAQVPKIINNALGLGHVLNTTAREEFTRRGVELMTNLKLIMAMNEHCWDGMERGDGFYSRFRLADAVIKTVPHCLRLARQGRSADERLPDLDSTLYCQWEPCRSFGLPEVISRVNDSLSMKVQTVLQVLARKGACFEGPWRAAAETALEIILAVVTCEPATVRRGGARIAFQGNVLQPESHAVRSIIGWHEHRRGLVKLEYPREDSIVITADNVHNSENVREGQNAVAIGPILGKSGRMKHTVPNLLPLLANGGASVGFVKVDLPSSQGMGSGRRCPGSAAAKPAAKGSAAAKPAAKGSAAAEPAAKGLLIFSFFDVVPEGNDMYASKTFKAVQDLWRQKGEIGESARAIARNLLHFGAWAQHYTGLIQLDGSWCNMFFIPWAISAPWLDP